jgi:hypothetical protein
LVHTQPCAPTAEIPEQGFLSTNSIRENQDQMCAFRSPLRPHLTLRKPTPRQPLLYCPAEKT